MKSKSLKYLAFLLPVFVFILPGCKKFLKESSQDLQYVRNYTQLDETLMGSGYEAHSPNYPTYSYAEATAYVYFPWLNMMDDDLTEFATFSYSDFRADGFGFYTWQRDPFVTDTYAPFTDDTWKKVYKNINAVNIIAKMATQLQDNPAELKRIRGEALFLRAGYYFMLVNTYAGAYKPATATTDLGVPLKITEFAEDRFFGRSTQDSVYKQIIADLNEAEVALTGINQRSLYRADINAVNLLQSRVYLYVQDWQNAIAAADKVIARKGTLYNLTAYTPKTSFFKASSPEAIFSQGNNAMVAITSENAQATYMPSAELMNLYSSTDLRKTAFFEFDQQGKYRYTKVYRSPNNNINPDAMYSDNFFLRNAEAYLNKAEASAMLHQDDKANAAINTLRSSRFSPANFQSVNLTGRPLVDFIRDERRRELYFKQQRWFDLKRYAVNPEYPFSKSISHPYSVYDSSRNPSLGKVLVLAPNDPAYVIPIPSDVISFNQGVLIQNPIRPDRTF